MISGPRHIAPIVVAIGMAAGAASAATLGIATKPAPNITANGTFFSIPGLLFEFSAAGGASTTSPPETGLVVALDGLFDGSEAQEVALNVGPGGSNPEPFFGASSLVDFGYVFDDTAEDTLEFLLADLSGDVAGAFEPRVLVTLIGEFGTEAGFFADGTQLGSASITVAPVAETEVIPLPAAAPLLFGGLAMLLGLRRRS